MITKAQKEEIIHRMEFSLSLVRRELLDCETKRTNKTLINLESRVARLLGQIDIAWVVMGENA